MLVDCDSDLGLASSVDFQVLRFFFSLFFEVGREVFWTSFYEFEIVFYLGLAISNTIR